MKKSKLSVVILYGLCAAIWTILAILAAVHKAYEYSQSFFVLTILCALVWFAAFVRWLIKYCSNDRKKDNFH